MLDQSQCQTGKTLEATRADIEKTIRSIHDATWNIRRLEREISLLEAIIDRNKTRSSESVTHNRFLSYVGKKDPDFMKRLTAEWSKERINEVLEFLLPTQDEMEE